VLARLTPYLSTFVLLALIAYFGFNVLTGDRGLLDARERQARLAADESRLKALRAERIELQQRALLLSDGYLSRDLLEERAHVVLGFADPRDYVIRTPEPAR
jgi:cell division protein FtsB